jgi:hypothetical protein
VSAAAKRSFDIIDARNAECLMVSSHALAVDDP